MGTKKCLQPPGKRFLVLNFALPYNERTPTLCGQGLQIFRISFAVAQELWFPILDIGLWNVGVFATMSVPEAAMNKYHFSPGRENEVRRFGEIGAVKPVAVSQLMDQPSYRNLRLHALAADRAHVRAAVYHVWFNSARMAFSYTAAAGDCLGR
jgi:hypothetical protein